MHAALGPKDSSGVDKKEEQEELDRLMALQAVNLK